MKICHLIYDDMGNPWLGGGGAWRARQIYRRLAGRHQITLITGRYPGAKAEEEEDGLRFLRVGCSRGYARSRLGYCAAAVACLKKQEWDLWVHDFSSFAPLWAPRRLRRRGILLLHHLAGRHAIAKRPLFGPAAWAAERLTVRAYGRVVTVSPSVRERVLEMAGDRARRVDCICNGVDERLFELPAAEDDYLLYFGRADVHTKGLDLLLRAFDRIAPDYPQLKLKLAGRGSAPQQEQLGRLVRGCAAAGRIEVVGEVDEEGKGELLRRALFLCAPSRYEGWCIAAVEASAAGKAVLGARIDGLRDAVSDGETGILVPPESVEHLERGMRRLLDDEPLRRRLGEQGRIRARRFDWDRVALDQEAVYLSAAAENEGL